MDSPVTFTAIDFETTGSVPGWPVEPWQIGLCRISPEKGVETTFSAYLGVSPDRPFNPHAPGRHASIRDELARMPTLPQCWGEVAPWIVGRPLVAHNVGTERSILKRAAPLHALGPWIDTLRLVRRCYPHLASAALSDLLESFQLVDEVERICPGLAPHDALFDAVGCGVLLLHFLALPGWEAVSLADLATI